MKEKDKNLGQNLLWLSCQTREEILFGCMHLQFFALLIIASVVYDQSNQMLAIKTTETIKILGYPKML